MPVKFCDDFKNVDEMYTASNKITVTLSYKETDVLPRKAIKVKVKFKSLPVQENTAVEVLDKSETAGT